jgi:hypothetical protein
MGCHIIYGLIIAPCWNKRKLHAGKITTPDRSRGPVRCCF